MVAAALQRAARAFGLPPSGAGDGHPPGRGLGALGMALPDVLRHEQVKYEGPAEALGVGGVARRVDEGGELRVGDGMDAHAERADGHPPHGPFAVLGKTGGIVGAHQEGSAGQADCVGDRRGAGVPLIPAFSPQGRRGRTYPRVVIEHVFRLGGAWIPAFAGMTEGWRLPCGAGVPLIPAFSPQGRRGRRCSRAVLELGARGGRTWIPAPYRVRGRLFAGMTEGWRFG